MLTLSDMVFEGNADLKQHNCITNIVNVKNLYMVRYAAATTLPINLHVTANHDGIRFEGNMCDKGYLGIGNLIQKEQT